MQEKKRNNFIRVLTLILSIVLFYEAVQILLPIAVRRMRDNAKVEKQITITVDENGKASLFPEVDEDNIDDSRYRDSIEEAVRLDSIVKDLEDEYTRKVDEIIFQMESDEYVVVYYRSIKNKKFQRFTLAKFKKKEFDGQVKYAYLYNEIFNCKKGAIVLGNFQSGMEQILPMKDLLRDFGVEPDNKRFLWGVTTFDDVYRMKLDGQEPTEIIPYDVFGSTEYFWYYEDVQGDKPFGQMEITIEE